MSARAATSRGHGEPLTYRGHGGRRGCRCDQCREAHRVHTAAARAENAARGLAPGHPAHGTRNGYDHYRCRCDQCVTAHEVARRDYDEAHPDRLRDLQVRRKARLSGWPLRACPICGRELGRYVGRDGVARVPRHYRPGTPLCSDLWCPAGGRVMTSEVTR